MIAYKFLRSGAVGLVSGFGWPKPRGGAPGEWVESVGPLRACESGVHVCRGRDLPYWMHDELWTIEVDGEVVEAADMLIALRGRLLSRVDSWNPDRRTAFVEACRDRAAEHVARTPPARRTHGEAFMGHMGKYLRLQWTQLGALCAALAIASTTEGGDDDAAGAKALYRSEREWQARWLVEHLGLAHAPF
jgi:hypothetical protein